MPRKKTTTPTISKQNGFARVRHAARHLLEVEASLSYGTPALKVQGKLFARLMIRAASRIEDPIAAPFPFALGCQPPPHLAPRDRREVHSPSRHRISTPSTIGGAIGGV